MTEKNNNNPLNSSDSLATACHVDKSCPIPEWHVMLCAQQDIAIHRTELDGKPYNKLYNIKIAVTNNVRVISFVEDLLLFWLVHICTFPHQPILNEFLCSLSSYFCCPASAGQ